MSMPGAEDRDGPAAAIERAAMRGRINAAREAANDHDAGPRQIERNFVGRVETFLGRRARADHRDTDVSERAAIAAESRDIRAGRRFPSEAAGSRAVPR